MRHELRRLARELSPIYQFADSSARLALIVCQAMKMTTPPMAANEWTERVRLLPLLPIELHIYGQRLSLS